MKLFTTALCFMIGAAIPAGATDLIPATMDDAEIPASGYLAPEGDPSVLESGSFRFNGAFFTMDGFSWWNGYAFANIPGNDYQSLDDQYMSAPGGGCNSPAYAVAFPEAYSIEFSEAVVPGMNITNTAYTYMAMTVGDAYARKFEAGDYFKLIITGHHADGTESTLDYYLADLRSDNESERYIVGWWDWVDLTSLGAITSLTFAFESTDMSYGYPNTPTYFCLDNLGAESSAIAAIEPEAPAVELLADGRTLTIRTDMTDYPVEIYTPDGILRRTARLSGTSTLTDLPAGLLLLRIAHRPHRLLLH